MTTRTGVRRIAVFAASLALLLGCAAAPRPAASRIEIADRVVVYKAERKLLLMRGDRVLRLSGVAWSVAQRTKAAGR